MIHDEHRRVAAPDLLFESWLLFEHAFKFEIVIFYVLDRFGQFGLDVVVIFVLKYSGLRYIAILKQLLMDIFLADQKVHIDI